MTGSTMAIGRRSLPYLDFPVHYGRMDICLRLRAFHRPVLLHINNRGLYLLRKDKIRELIISGCSIILA